MKLLNKFSDYFTTLSNNRFYSLFCLKKALSALFYWVLGTSKASKYGPLRLQIEVTDKCNFNCIMCDRHNLKKIRSNLNNDISYHEFKRIIKELKPLYVTLNGLGEPMLNKEIFKFIRLCNEKKITSSIPLNMSLMNDSKIEEFNKNPPSICAFSLHGATASSFNSLTNSLKFNDCVINFEKLISKINQKKTSIHILCVLQSKNLEEYDYMFNYLEKWKLLNSFNLVPVFDFKVNQEIIPSDIQIKNVLNKLNIEIKKSNSINRKQFLINWRSKIITLKKQTSKKVDGPCLFPWLSTYITATGNVLPCCYLTNEKYIMGNIKKTSFTKIWNGKKYKHFRNLLVNSRRNIDECYGCSCNHIRRIKRYRFITFGFSYWLTND